MFSRLKNQNFNRKHKPPRARESNESKNGILFGRRVVIRFIIEARQRLYNMDIIIYNIAFDLSFEIQIHVIL